MTYKKQRKQILEYAKQAIQERNTTSEEFIGDIWFRKMNQDHNYIAGNKEYIFHIVNIENRYYMNKIY